MAGVYGSDIRRDESAGANHITIYHRRIGCPVYLSCPECGITNHVQGELLEDIRDSDEDVYVKCPGCHEDTYVDESHLEIRAYTRLGAIEIGGW